MIKKLIVVSGFSGAGIRGKGVADSIRENCVGSFRDRSFQKRDDWNHCNTKGSDEGGKVRMPAR